MTCRKKTPSPMHDFQYQVDINIFKKNLLSSTKPTKPTTSASLLSNNTNNSSLYTQLCVFDFDSTLFRSPLPNPKLWSSKLAGKLISDCWWFFDARTLQSPYIPENPSNEWWNAEVVEKVAAALANPENLVIVLTGRNRRIFDSRIKQLIHEKTYPTLPVHLIICKEVKALEESGSGKEYASTLDFKIGVLTEFLSEFPSINSIALYDDRENHIKLFDQTLDIWKKGGKITSFTLQLVTETDMYMEADIEKELVFDLVKSHNDRIAACVADPGLSVQFTHLSIEAESTENLRARRKTISNFRTPIELEDEIEYSAIFLDADSKTKLLTEFPIPAGWKPKSDHMTVSFGKINQELVDEMGGLCSVHRLLITHFGSYKDCCSAVKVDPDGKVKSENEVMHITLFISQSGNARQSNLITEWQPLPTLLELQGTLDVKKVMGMKAEPPPPVIKNEVSIGQLVMKHHPHLKGKQIGIMVAHVNKWMSKQFVVNLEGNKANIEFFISNADFSLINVVEQS